MFVLSCCTIIDMPKSFYQERSLHYLMLQYQIDGTFHRDEIGTPENYKEFYQKIREGAMPTTSQINPTEFVERFETLLKEGKDVLHISLSSGISGTYHSAAEAQKILQKKYPERKLYVVDSLAASAGCGLLVTLASDMQKSGASIDEVHDWLEENKRKVNHLFFTTDLTHLKRGGRVSSTAALLANILHICPLMTVNHEGKLVPMEKIRSVKKCIKTAVSRMLELADKGADYDGYCYISHSDIMDVAQDLKSQIQESFPKIKKICISDIGRVIGSHTGPGTVAFFFVGKKRTS